MRFQRDDVSRLIGRFVSVCCQVAKPFGLQKLGVSRLRCWLVAMVVVLAACMDVSPYETRLPADLSKRPAKLANAIGMLPKNDQDMLSRYMLRKKLSSSYNKGAPPRSRTIKAALAEQAKYETAHPNDPTGKVAYLKHINGVTDDSNQRLLVSILRLKELPDDFNLVEIQLMFSNAYAKPVRAFSGTVRVQDVDNAASFIDIPISESFLSPIAVEDTRKVRHKVSIARPVVMKAIKDVAEVRASLVSAKVMLTNDTEFSW